MLHIQLHLLPFILPLPLSLLFLSSFFPSSSSPVVPLTLLSLSFSFSSFLSPLFLSPLFLSHPFSLFFSSLLFTSRPSSPLSPLLSFLFIPPVPLSSLLAPLSLLSLSSLLSLLFPFHSSPELASRAPISCIRCHKLRTSDKFKCGRCGDIYLTKAVVTSGEGGGEEAALSQLSAWKRRKEARDSQENNSGAAVTLQGDSEGSGTFVISHFHVCVGTM